MPSAQLGEVDTITILVATDNHVGYAERDAIRKDDSWRSFEEIMSIAKDRGVDMVLLAGDLFHDNKPSRSSLFEVMRILREYCLGDKPCELEMLSDETEAFQGKFDHVNYEDPDINVSLPVFSIHGNHDDPSGEGPLASLDLLQVCGLVNYYGRTLESDNILVKPILLQKGRTKLAMYGMSNVRDERMHRTFRDGKVKFFKPTIQESDWFNIMSVHQNHHAYTQKGYLPEEFLPSFMDMIIWGHEHECRIEPRYNPTMDFHIMQPGSSIATSLAPGEAEPKHVAILKITGKKFECEPIRLKTVRPFVMKEIVLMDDPVAKKLANKENNRNDLTRRLSEIVRELIQQAKHEWLEQQNAEDELDVGDAPKPLVRLRVEYSAPEGSQFDLENPQRFSSNFSDDVANVTDVVQYHRRKRGTSLKTNGATMPEQSVMAQMNVDSVQVEKLVKEFLAAQSLTILPQNTFSDAVAQFVDKDDKHAMEVFLQESLKSQVNHLVELDKDEDEEQRRADLAAEMSRNKSKLEDMFAKGHLKRVKHGRLKPKPEAWDSDLDGSWAEQPGAMIFSEADDGDVMDEDHEAVRSTVKGKGKATARTAATKKTTATKATRTTNRGRKKAVIEDEEEDEEPNDDDAMVIDDDSNEDGMFVKPKPPPKGRKSAAATKPRVAPARSTRAAASTTEDQLVAAQTRQSSISSWARGKSKTPVAAEVEEISDDDDDDDAFEPMKPVRKR